jgi:hypothetical protein
MSTAVQITASSSASHAAGGMLVAMASSTISRALVPVG